MSHRYYSTQRPVAPGSFPKPDGNKVLEIVNFDKRIPCPEIGRDAWGYIDYEKPLDKKAARNYELVKQERIKMQEIMCSRNDCDFWLCGHCGYGGTAVTISEYGCETWEPVDDND